MSTESDFFSHHFSSKALETLVRFAALATVVSQAESRHWPDLERDAVPVLRRLNFNSALLLGAFTPGIKVKPVRHPGGTHVLLKSGGVTLYSLTRSRMRERISLQPYQRTLSRAAQQSLGFMPQLPTPTEKELAALMLYGADYRSRRLRVCAIVFPTYTGEFAPGTINLIEKYGHVVDQFDNTEYAKAEIARFIKIRESIRA